MPCYLFTWHAYATWMPDRTQGYVRKGHGILPPDAAQARRYRARQKEATATHRRFRLHGVATEPTHLHVLLSWPDERAYDELRRGLRESISRRLTAHLRRRWLEAGGSRKQVRDQTHFDRLMNVYLPKHHGWKWREGIGFFR